MEHLLPRVHMRCEACQGTGFIPYLETHIRVPRPCEECGGSGIAHCCEGLCESRETQEEMQNAESRRQNGKQNPSTQLGVTEEVH